MSKTDTFEKVSETIKRMVITKAPKNQQEIIDYVREKKGVEIPKSTMSKYLEKLDIRSSDSGFYQVSVEKVNSVNRNILGKILWEHKSVVYHQNLFAMSLEKHDEIEQAPEEIYANEIEQAPEEIYANGIEQAPEEIYANGIEQAPEEELEEVNSKKNMGRNIYSVIVTCGLGFEHTIENLASGIFEKDILGSLAGRKNVIFMFSSLKKASKFHREMLRIKKGMGKD